MAELNTGGDGGKGGKVRSKKMNPSVDLTAMVDLAFLLITFFMLTTSLTRPQSMNLAMPDKNKQDPKDNQAVANDRTMTILLGKDNSVLWYFGEFTEPLIQPTESAFGKDGIRKVILQRKAAVEAAYKGQTDKDGNPKGLIVIIKPSDKSKYKNLVDILDEMAITDVKIYAIGDITDDEVQLLTDKGMN